MHARTRHPPTNHPPTPPPSPAAQLRVLWSNMVSFGWTTFLILRARSAPTSTSAHIARRTVGGVVQSLAPRLPVYKSHRV